MIKNTSLLSEVHISTFYWIYLLSRWSALLKGNSLCIALGFIGLAETSFSGFGSSNLHTDSFHVITLWATSVKTHGLLKAWLTVFSILVDSWEHINLMRTTACTWKLSCLFQVGRAPVVSMGVIFPYVPLSFKNCWNFSRIPIILVYDLSNSYCEKRISL